MNNWTYYQRNKEIILNRAKYYHKNDKERLREQARNKYRNLSQEDKKKKREYGKNRYHNMSEEKKQKLKKYQKNIENQKSLSIIMNKIVHILFFSNYSSLSISDSVSSSELLSDSLFSKSSSI